ncbi:N/A [soil metagenome]
MQVLFVEDDPMNRRVVRDMLSVAGVDMDEAETAELGLAKIDGADYAIVLMDLRMPGMDGFEAIRAIRDRTDAKAKLPIIVVTADAGSDLRHRCFEAGADDVVMKPVAMRILFDSIGRLLAAAASEPVLT